METDADLKRDVLAELAWDPAVNALNLKVAVRDGVVTISGRLEAYSERCAVEKALQRINGARDFQLKLDVVLPLELQRSDAEIAQAARAALQWSAPALMDDVSLSVCDGWLTLEGEVDRPSLRRRVEEAMRDLTGLVGVSNKLKVPGSAASAVGAASGAHAALR
jgi:osmotically-inducible protein OsmY